MNMERQMAIENIKKWYFEQSKRHSILSYLRRYNASEILQKWYSVNWKRKFIFHYLQSQIIASVNSLFEDNRVLEYSIINRYNQNCECDELTSRDEDIGKELRADNFEEELQKDEDANIQKDKLSVNTEDKLSQSESTIIPNIKSLSEGKRYCKPKKKRKRCCNVV
ncbi:uncharacterized protein [Centruroides vittatus]|uniref:uncharacterized protein n=1 Tax=Centruroides vittatus TaxID=120091 RepID=UPI00350EEC59